MRLSDGCDNFNLLALTFTFFHSHIRCLFFIIYVGRSIFLLLVFLVFLNVFHRPQQKFSFAYVLYFELFRLLRQKTSQTADRRDGTHLPPDSAF